MQTGPATGRGQPVGSSKGPVSPVITRSGERKATAPSTQTTNKSGKDHVPDKRNPSWDPLLLWVTREAHPRSGHALAVPRGPACPRTDSWRSGREESAPRRLSTRSREASSPRFPGDTVPPPLRTPVQAGAWQVRRASPRVRGERVPGSRLLGWGADPSLGGRGLGGHARVAREEGSGPPGAAPTQGAQTGGGF